MNDQLVEVNGVSLSGMDNAHAIQVLREAMMKDGRIHGFIGIAVLRPRTARSAAQLSSPCREVRVSQAENEDVVDGTVSTLPRPDPAERLPAVDESNRDMHGVADSLSVSLPSDMSQVCFCCQSVF